jgi:hypothetical protein
MKNSILLLLIAASVEATRLSPTYATSTWNPRSRFSRKRPAPKIQLDDWETEESTKAVMERVLEQEQVDDEERQRIAPASAKAALIAVVSATVIGGARHAIELVL